MRRLPGPAVDRLGEEGNFQCHLRIVSGLAENTNLIFCADSSESQTANGCPVLRGAGTISREATVRERRSRPQSIARSPERAQESCAFLLTLTYIDAGQSLEPGTSGVATGFEGWGVLVLVHEEVLAMAEGFWFCGLTGADSADEGG